MLALKATPEFVGWRDGLHPSWRVRISARFDLVRAGHFGDSKGLGDGLFEMRWRNGLRVCYLRRRVAGADVIIVWGGFKGTQDADIAKARSLKKRYEKELANEG